MHKLAKFAERLPSRHSGEAFSTMPHLPKLGHVGQTVNARGFAYATRCARQPLVAHRRKYEALGYSTAALLLPSLRCLR
jgi:hypothetical protein